MKKNLFVLGIATLAMSACSSTDVLEEGIAKQSNAISFDTHINKSTRAIDNDHFSAFYVYGSYRPKNAQNTYYPIFTGQDAVTSENNAAGPWKYNNERYWIPGATYKFYACSDENKNVTTGDQRASYDGKSFSIVNYLCDMNNQDDLVFAETNDILATEKDNPEVGFSFKHILARLQFTFETTFGEGNIVEIKNFRVNNIRNKGNFAYGLIEENKWAWSADREWTPTTAYPRPVVTPKFGTTESSTATCTSKQSVTSNYVYVIPCKYNGPDVDVLFDITVKRENPEEGVDPIVLERSLKSSWTPGWEMGKTYSYNVKINGTAAGVEPIVFSVIKVEDWVKGEPTQPNMGVDAGHNNPEQP